MRKLYLDNGNEQFKFADTTTKIRLNAYDDDRPASLTRDAKVRVKNNSGYLLEASANVDKNQAVITSGQLNKLPVGSYLLELWDTVAGGIAIYPSDGFLRLQINENTTGISGGIISSITVDDFTKQISDLSQQLKREVSEAVVTGLMNDKGDKGAGAHNATYRGANLGSALSETQAAAIKAGNFNDLFIGDYWTISGVTYRIAAFDYYFNTGDKPCTDHHVVLVPDTPLYSAKMNGTNTTVGAYVGSEMYATGLSNAKATITAAFGSAHLLNHRNYLQNASTNGVPTGAAWFDSTVELMTEQNVYGNQVMGALPSGGTVNPWDANGNHNYLVDKSQFPLFIFRPDLISNRQWFWLRTVVSATAFADVHVNGNADSAGAAASAGVRPAFSIY